MTRNEGGNFVLVLKIQSTSNLTTWQNLDLTNAVIKGDEIRLVIPGDEAEEFIRVLGSE